MVSCMTLLRRLTLAVLATGLLVALAAAPASMGGSTGTIWQQSGWVTLATPHPGVVVQRKQIWVTGYPGARTITRVTWPIGSSHVTLDAMPMGTYRPSDAGFGGSRISAISGGNGFLAGINGDTFSGGWYCNYCHLHGLLVHNRTIRNFGVEGPAVGFSDGGNMIMGQPIAVPVHFLLKGMQATVGAFGALPSSSNYDQLGIYTSGSVKLPAGTYGVAVSDSVLASLLRTATPRSILSINGLGHKEPVKSFRLADAAAPAAAASLPVLASYTAGAQVWIGSGRMLLVGRTGATGPRAGSALQRTVQAAMPIGVTLSDQGWGPVDDVMDGKFQLVENGMAHTAYPGWSDSWPWTCMGSSYGCFRTALGRNGNTGFLAIVGVSGGYGGLTTPDWARVLKALGATQAMGFDANSAAELYRAGAGAITNADGGRIIPSSTALRYN
jgi:hypothetical protein